MKGFRDFRIRSQINLIVCVAAALLVLTMGAVYIAFDTIMTRMAVDRFNELAARGGESVRTTLHGIETNARNYAYILGRSGYPYYTGTDIALDRVVADAYASINTLSDDMVGVALTTPEETIHIGTDAEAEALLMEVLAREDLVSNETLHSFFTESLTALSGTGESTKYFAHVAPIANPDDPNKASGYLVSLFGYQQVRQVMQGLIGHDDRNLALLLEGDAILLGTSNSTEEEHRQMAEWLQESASGEFDRWMPVRFRDAPTLVMSARVPETDWTLVLLVPRAVIKAPINALGWIAAAILLGGIAILAFASVMTIRAIIRPVETMVRSMSGFDRPGSPGEIPIPSDNEVGVVATHINEMVKKLREAEQRTHEAETRSWQAELSRMQMELSYFQSQINPHFLYNTLESIRSMSVVYGAEEIGDLAVSTAAIFRYAVRPEQTVTLREELDCVREYIHIMQLRFPDRYRVTEHVAPPCMDLPLFRMLLQPLVENAFKHGLKHRARNGRIHLAAVFVPEGCRITITDNGEGIEPERLEVLRRHLADAENPGKPNALPGLGLANIHRRLQVGLGTPYGVVLDSVAGRWTRVTLLLPKVPINGQTLL